MEKDLVGGRDVNKLGMESTGMDPAEFKKQVYSQLRNTGVINSVKSQLRAQLLSQLQKGQMIKLAPPTGDAPTLKRKALNSMISEYLNAFNYQYSLSVFAEESGSSGGASISEEELLDILRIERKSALHNAFVRAKHAAQQHGPTCAIMALMEAVADVAHGGRGSDNGTQTSGGDRYHLEVRLQQLESEYAAKLRAERMRPAQGVEERMALYRAEIDEQSRAEVARQVERIREVEVASARMEEAAKWRKQAEAERLELDRLHNERLSRLRQREEDMNDKLRRQQREVEALAFEHRQRIMREEERIRAWKAELSQQLDVKEEELRGRAAAMEARERAVTAREAAAEKRVAEASEAIANASVSVRHEVEREYLEMKATLNNQRMQLEMDRSRVVEMRSEAAAEVAQARAVQDRLRNLESARAEAEARAAAHAADAEIMRLQVEKMQHELSLARDELARRITQATDSADAMLNSAAGAMSMLEAEAGNARSTVAQLRAVQGELVVVKEDLKDAVDARAKAEKDRDKYREKVAALSEQVEVLQRRLAQVQGLLEEAMGAREECLRQVEDANFAANQMAAEVSELRDKLSRAREEAMALKVASMAVPQGVGGLMSGAATPSASALAAAAAGAATGGSRGMNCILMGLAGHSRPGTALTGATGFSVGSRAYGGLMSGAPGGSYMPPPSAAAAAGLRGSWAAMAASQSSGFSAPLGAAGGAFPYGVEAPQAGGTSPTRLMTATAAGGGASPARPHTSASWMSAGMPPWAAAQVPQPPVGAWGVGAEPAGTAAAIAAAGVGNRPRSPVMERLEDLQRSETDMAADLVAFRRRAAQQREAGQQELRLVQHRLGGMANDSISGRSSPVRRPSGTGEDEPTLSRMPNSLALRAAITASLPPADSNQVVPLPVPLPASLQPGAAAATAAPLLLPPPHPAVRTAYPEVTNLSGATYGSSQLQLQQAGMAATQAYSTQPANAAVQQHLSHDAAGSRNTSAGGAGIASGVPGMGGNENVSFLSTGSASLSFSHDVTLAHNILQQQQQQQQPSSAPRLSPFASPPVDLPPWAPPAPSQAPPPQQQEQRPQLPSGLIVTNALGSSSGGGAATAAAVPPPRSQPISMAGSVEPGTSRPSAGGTSAGGAPPGLVLLPSTGQQPTAAPPPGLTLVTATSSAGGSPPAQPPSAVYASQAADAPAPPPPNSAPSPAPSLPAPPPGLMLVRNLSQSFTPPAVSPQGDGPQANSDQKQQSDAGAADDGPRALVRAPSYMDIESAQQARLRMLKEQQEARLREQREQEEERRRQEEEEAATAQQHHSHHGYDDDDDELHAAQAYHDDLVDSPGSAASHAGASDAVPSGRDSRSSSHGSSAGGGWGQQKRDSGGSGHAGFASSPQSSSGSTGSAQGLEAPDDSGDHDHGFQDDDDEDFPSGLAGIDDDDGSAEVVDDDEGLELAEQSSDSVF